MSVKGADVKATGKAKVVVKQGKKKFKTVTVTIKNGKGKVTLKNLKKGAYKVTTSYGGDAAHLASKGKGSFRI